MADPHRAAAMNHLMTSEGSLDVDLMIPEGDRALRALRRLPLRPHFTRAPGKTTSSRPKGDAVRGKTTHSGHSPWLDRDD